MQKLLLNVSFDSDLTKKYGALLVQLMADQGYVQHNELVTLLIEQKADLNNTFSADGKNVLDYAIDYGDLELIKLLLRNNADLCRKDTKSLTPICQAAQKNRWDIVKLIAKTRHSGLGDPAEYGGALLDAISDKEIDKEKKRELVEVLLNAGASPRWHYSNAKKTTLHCAIDCGDLKLLELLLSSNVNISYKIKGGQTPIHYAASRKLWCSVAMIAKTYYADRSDQAGYGLALNLVLAEQSYTEYKELAKLLIMKRANLNSQLDDEKKLLCTMRLTEVIWN